MMQDAEKEWKSLQNRGISCCSCGCSLPMKQVSFFSSECVPERTDRGCEPKVTRQHSFPFSPGTHTQRFPTLGATWCCPPHSHLPRSSWSICPFIRNPLLLSVLFHIACTRKFFFPCVILEIWVFYSKVPPTWDPGGHVGHCETRFSTYFMTARSAGLIKASRVPFFLLSVLFLSFSPFCCCCSTIDAHVCKLHLWHTNMFLKTYSCYHNKPFSLLRKDHSSEMVPSHLNCPDFINLDMSGWAAQISCQVWHQVGVSVVSCCSTPKSLKKNSK